MTRRRDDAVVARAKVGEADAWRALYRAHAGRLKLWLDTIPTGDTAVDSEDIAASAWLTASRRIGDFHGSLDDFAGWLFAIARTARATGARRQTYPTDVMAADPRQFGVVDDPSAQVDAAQLAHQLIRMLPPREAEIVACIDVAGLDNRSTAEVLGISEVAVRVGHHRGIGRLRRLLAEAHPLAEPAPPRVRPDSTPEASS